MSLQSFIYHFGGGKIRLKYRLIEEKYGKPKRKLIEFSLVIIFLLQIGVGAAFLNTKSGLFIIGAGLIITGALEVYIFKIINRSIHTGTMYFFDDHLLIRKTGQVSIYYSDITSIYFRTYLVSHRGGTRNPTYNAMSAHAYLIQINTKQNSYALKVENDLWLTEEDKMQFHRYYPLMMYTLEELYNKYRIPMEEKSKKFEFQSI